MVKLGEIRKPTNKNLLTLEQMVFEHLITQRGSWPDALIYCVSIRAQQETGFWGTRNGHSYETGPRESQKAPQRLEPGLVEPTARAVGRWSPVLLGHHWVRGWWLWGAGMGPWTVGSVASPRGWAGMVRVAGALRAMAVTFSFEDFWEDLRNVLLQTGKSIPHILTELRHVAQEGLTSQAETQWSHSLLSHTKPSLQTSRASGFKWLLNRALRATSFCLLEPKGQLRSSSEASMSMSAMSGCPPERLGDMALSNCTCKKHQQKPLWAQN